MSNHELPKKTTKTTTKNEVTIEGKALGFFSANGNLGESSPLKPVYPERLLDNQEEPYEALVHFRQIRPSSNNCTVQNSKMWLVFCDTQI